MRPRIVLVSLVSLAVLGLPGMAAADHPGNAIVGLEVLKGAEATQVVLMGRTTPTFTVFKLRDPDRLVVDLIGCDLQDVDTPQAVNNAHVGRIATTQFKQAGSVVSRFIIELKPGVVFDAKAEGPAIMVTIGAKHAARSPAAKPKPRPAPPSVAASPAARAVDRAPREQAKDHQVVESHGKKKGADRLRIRRIVTGARDSVTLLADKQVANYEVMEVFEPFRLVLDVYGASMKTRKHERKLSGKHASRFRAVRYGNKVRVVLDSAGGERQRYVVKRTRRGIRVAFLGKKGPKPKTPAVAAATKPAPAPTAKTAEPEPAPKATVQTTTVKTTEPVSAPAVQTTTAEPAAADPSTLRDVSFRQETQLARVILEIDGEATPEVVHADGRSAVLEIPRCKMPLILERTLDTSEFGSAIQSLSAYRVRDEDKVKLVAVTTSRVPSRLERRDGKLHWVFETQAKGLASAGPAARPESAEFTYAPDQVAGYSVRQPEMAASSGAGKKRRKFRGKRISLDFKDADIHNILRLISEVAKLNIITSDEVKGKITITMRNVPWDQALDIILKTKKLGKVRHGNIIRVATMNELSKEREMMQKAAEANKQLEPLRVRLVPVNYAVANEIVEQVKDVLSERGNVTIDKRTNVLIIKDVLENLIKAEGLVRSLDTETPQVLIEARIVEASSNFERQIGVQWGGRLEYSGATGNPTGVAFPSTVKIKGGADDPTTNSDLLGVTNPGNFAVNLPAAVGAGSGGALGFTFASVTGIAQLDLRLSAMEERGTLKIVSAPRITTLDNHTAKIGSGLSIPISVVSAAGVNTQFVEAKLELEVTPHITQEGSILMAIKVMKNEPDFSRTGARGDPTILKREAETQVLVRDGDTTVIGGIYTKSTSENTTGVPVLSKIPILGFLFRHTRKTDERNELLIFVTPRIVNRLQATVSQK